MENLRIDCGSCRARGPACADCMMTALLGPVEGAVEFDADEVSALRQMTASGLLPPLRLVRGVTAHHPEVLDPGDDSPEGFANRRHAL